MIAKQKEAHIDIINDGEQGRTDYTVHVIDRLTGFEGQSDAPRGTGEPEFPRARAVAEPVRLAVPASPGLLGAVAWKDFAAAEADIARAKAAMTKAGVEEYFMTSPSPGQIARYLKNNYYKTVEEYLFTLADVMQREYRAIVDAGFILQWIAPISRCLTRSIRHQRRDYRKIISMNVEALNHAVKDLPSDRMRMHVCWGSTLGPHHGDIPIKEIVDIILKAKPMAVSFPAPTRATATSGRCGRTSSCPAARPSSPA